jgi:GntR family transcriptional repressor for pyruvate dehydrogenase complex
MGKNMAPENKKERAEHIGSQSALTMRVVEHLRQMVQKGELGPGARLPAERDLSQMLKVSRSSLRAGIGFLSAMGVLRPRHGSGTYVAEGPPAFDASMLQVMGSLHGHKPSQMFEARLVVEQGLAGLAAERATDQHLATLAEEVAEMYATLDDPQEYLVHDVRFHRTLAAAAANPILTALMETITAALYGQRRETVMYAQDLKESVEMHREIYRAVRARDAAKARSAMALHLSKAQSAQAREVVANSATRAGKRASPVRKVDRPVPAR